MHNEGPNLENAITGLGLGKPLYGHDGPDALYPFNGEILTGQELIDLFQMIQDSNQNESDGAETCQQFAKGAFEYLKEHGFKTVTPEPTYFALPSDSLTEQYKVAFNIPDSVNFLVCAVPATRYGNLDTQPLQFNPTHNSFQLVSPEGELVSNSIDTQTALYNRAMESFTLVGLYVEDPVNLSLLYKYYYENLVDPEQGVLTIEEFLLTITQGIPGNQSRVAYSEDPSTLIDINQYGVTIPITQIHTYITPPGTMFVLTTRPDGTFNYSVKGIEANEQPFKDLDRPTAIQTNELIGGIANSTVPSTNITTTADNLHITGESQGAAIGSAAILTFLALSVLTFGTPIIVEKIKASLKKNSPPTEGEAK